MTLTLWLCLDVMWNYNLEANGHNQHDIDNPMTLLLFSRRLETAALLLEQGALVGQADPLGFDALLFSAYWGFNGTTKRRKDKYNVYVICTCIYIYIILVYIYFRRPPLLRLLGI
jgi:hypothetical protein